MCKKNGQAGSYLLAKGNQLMVTLPLYVDNTLFITSRLYVSIILQAKCAINPLN